MVSFHALVHLLHTAPPAPLPSRNLKLLKGAPLPSLLTFTRNHPARPLLSKLILHQDHLANWASWEYGERELGAWREIVYDVTTYADQPNFGPFQTYFAFGQGGLKVRGADWTVVNAIAQCMGDNLRRSAENGDWEGEYEDVPLTRELARPNSGSKQEGGDWAGLGGCDVSVPSSIPRWSLLTTSFPICFPLLHAGYGQVATRLSITLTGLVCG